MILAPSAEDRPVRREQKYLGDKEVIALVALLSAFVPLFTDLYLLALPTMGDFFQVSVHLTILTLGLVNLVIGTLCGCLWLLISRLKIARDVPDSVRRSV